MVAAVFPDRAGHRRRARCFNPATTNNRAGSTLLLLGLIADRSGSPGNGAGSPSRLGSRSAIFDLGRRLRDDRGPVTTLVGRADLHGPRPGAARRIAVDRLTSSSPIGRRRGPTGIDGDTSVTAGAARGRGRGHLGIPRPLPGARGRCGSKGPASSSPTCKVSSYFETFLRRPVGLAVLPKLVDAEARQRATKRFNLLPPPGIHRLRRPGSGSELLDLRDYRPGDPPKRIAWKASARRDKLITRELESEVPIRCTLFVDASDAGAPRAAGRQRCWPD